MRPFALLTIVASFGLSACALQEPAPTSTTELTTSRISDRDQPTAEHHLLAELRGQWRGTVTQDGTTTQCTMNVTLLGDLWVVENLTGISGDRELAATVMLGYDTRKKCFVAARAYSNSSQLITMESTSTDPRRRIYVYELTDRDGKVVRRKEVFEQPAGSRTLEATLLGVDDGGRETVLRKVHFDRVDAPAP